MREQRNPPTPPGLDRFSTVNTPSPVGLRVRLFGRLTVTWGGKEIGLPHSDTVLSLLAYLVMHAGRPLPRAALVGTFWPDRPEPDARKALSHALWQIRRSLGPAADRLQGDRDTVSFALLPEDWTDVAAFKAHLLRGREEPVGAAVSSAGQSTRLAELSAAVALYRGPLLEGCYDDWVLLEQERLREAYLSALERLLDLYRQQEEYEQALGCAQRLVAADPLREAAYRELMRLYHVLGRDRAALCVYADLYRLLDQELGVEPAAATTALYREIAASTAESEPAHLPVILAPPSQQDLGHLPFVGRAKERAALLRSLQAANRGRGGLALVEGDAGVGKTRLVGEVLAEAEWRGLQIGQAKADPHTRLSPHQLLRDALYPLLSPLRLAQLAELVPPLWLAAVIPLFPGVVQQLPQLSSLSPLDPRQERERFWEGLVRFLVGLAAIRPLLLVLEDVHHADEASLAALNYLAPRLPASRALVVLTCRTAAAHERIVVRETLAALGRDTPLLRLRLLPFERAEGVALIRRALNAPEDDRDSALFAERLLGETGSNALFLVETLKSLLDQGSLVPRPGGGWTFPRGDQPLPTPASIQGLIAERMGRLPSLLRGELEWVAVLGGEVEFSILSRASDAEPTILLSHLEALVQRSFLVETEAGYRYEHDRIWETVYQAIPPGRRRRLHRRAGAALEECHPQRVESLAYHFSEAELWDKAADYHQKAGDQARSMYANAEAAEHYARALDALGRLPGPLDLGRAFGLRLAREAIFGIQGEREAQVKELHLLEELSVQLEDDRRRAELALRQATYAEAISDYPAAVAAAQEAIRLAQAVQDVALDAAGALQWGLALWRQGRYEPARSQVEQALVLARDARLPRLEADILRHLGIISWYLGDQPAARAHYEQSLQIAHELGDRWNETRALNNLGMVYWIQGDYAKAQGTFEQALQIKREIGDRWGEGSTLGNLGTVLSCLDNTVAIEYYEQALQIAREVGDRWGEGRLLNNIGLCFMDRGDYERARTYIERALKIRREVGDRQGEGATLGNLGEVFRNQGDYTRAKPYYEQALEISQEIGVQRGECWARIFLGLLAHLQGDDKAAQELGRQALQIAEETEDRPLQGHALTILGHASAGRGDVTNAVAHYGRALALRREVEEHNLSMEPLAGLAQVALVQDDVKGALAFVEEILAYLASGVLDGTKEPFRVYLTCYRVLRAGGDCRAHAMLERAHRLLQQRAARIADDALRRSFLEKVAAHREIVAAYEAAQVKCPPRPAEVRLPRADAPTGRPLRDDEYVEVAWAARLPEDEMIPDGTQRRRHRLQRLLRQAAEQEAAPTVEDLAQVLGVSARTIKRDLSALRSAGHAAPTRGSRTASN